LIFRKVTPVVVPHISLDFGAVDLENIIAEAAVDGGFYNLVETHYIADLVG
jgi:hypothetical protein